MSKKAIFILIVTVLCTFVNYAAPKTMSVLIKQTYIRDKASNFGKILATVKYGATVSVLEEKGQWYKVSTGRVTGWMNSTALTSKSVKLHPTQSDVNKAASSDEIYLAGRGFNEEVEKQYKQDNHLDFTWIDKMEAITIPPESMVSFLDKGNLNQE